jgi:hypothetical protein
MTIAAPSAFTGVESCNAKPNAARAANANPSSDFAVYQQAASQRIAEAIADLSAVRRDLRINAACSSLVALTSLRFAVRAIFCADRHLD